MSATKTAPAKTTAATAAHAPDSGPRRDFLLLTAQAMGAVGAAALIWPMVDSMTLSISRILKIMRHLGTD